MNIQFTVEAESVEDLHEKIIEAADMVKGWTGSDDQKHHLKLTYGTMLDLIKDYEVECKKDATPIIQSVANEVEIAHAPVETWPEIARLINLQLEEKRDNEQFDDLVKDLVW